MKSEEKIKYSPMIKQYLNIKLNYPDTLLLYRIGDFYEFFFDDAKKASQLLGIAMTSRGQAPMAGLPYHEVDDCIDILLKNGESVVICEQENSGPIYRKVKRITRYLI